MNPSAIEIKKLSIQHAQELTNLLKVSDQEYSKYFIPFSFDFQTISNLLTKAIKDQYYGVFVDNNIVGFYMLRGFDDSFEIPSYGVWISKKFSSKGLSKLTLHHAISFCRINKIQKLMLKVHPDNFIAKKMYEEFGFAYEGIDTRIGHHIYHKII